MSVVILTRGLFFKMTIVYLKTWSSSWSGRLYHGYFLRSVRPTDSVECRKNKDVIDEIPMAYKDIDAVMTAQSDLVDIIYTLKQILCIKG